MTLYIITALNAAHAKPAATDSYFYCDAGTGCEFYVSPGMGRHLKLTNLEKSFQYTCHINGLAALVGYNSTEAESIGIYDGKFSRTGLQTVDLTFSTSQLNVPEGYLYFNAENYGDIPDTEKILCEKAGVKTVSSGFFRP